MNERICPHCGGYVPKKTERFMTIVPEGKENAVPFLEIVEKMWGKVADPKKKLKTVAVYLSNVRRDYKAEWRFYSAPDRSLEREGNPRAYRHRIWKEKINVRSTPEHS